MEKEQHREKFFPVLFFYSVDETLWDGSKLLKKKVLYISQVGRGWVPLLGFLPGQIVPWTVCLSSWALRIFGYFLLCEGRPGASSPVPRHLWKGEWNFSVSARAIQFFPRIDPVCHVTFPSQCRWIGFPLRKTLGTACSTAGGAGVKGQAETL